MTLGAVSGGSLMKIGRRRAIFISSAIGLVGVLITFHMSFANLIIGRLLYGFSAGLISSITPRY